MNQRIKVSKSFEAKTSKTQREDEFAGIDRITVSKQC